MRVEEKEFDGFPVCEYREYSSTLVAGDDIYIIIPGLNKGVWAAVVEDETLNERAIVVREWGTKETHPIRRPNIQYVLLHSCECGASGPSSWRICHPEA